MSIHGCFSLFQHCLERINASCNVAGLDCFKCNSGQVADATCFFQCPRVRLVADRVDLVV